MSDSDDIWVNILIPIFVGPFCVFVKSLWDRYDLQKTEKKNLEFNEKIRKIKDKLSKFYWPVYIKLLCIYQMNFNIPITNYNISDSYSSSGEEESFIKYTTKKRKRCINYIDNDRCNKVIPINSNSNICRKCNWFEKKNIKQKRRKIKHKLKSNPDSNITINIEKKIDNDLTGNGIGVVKDIPKIYLDLDLETITNLKEKINNDYTEIKNIILSNISIVEPRSKFGKQLTRFLKYSEIYNVIYKSDKDYVPEQFGASDNTNKLLSLVEIKLFDLQKEYHELIKNGPYAS